MSTPVIYWYRQDLRLADLPALAVAAQSGPILPIYILDDEAPGEWAAGAASRWWLHHSLTALGKEIERGGGRLLLARGDSGAILKQLCEQTGSPAVYCSRQYEPWGRRLEQRVARQLTKIGCSLESLPGALLFEPEQVLNQSGDAYQVFTPFWRACRARPEPPAPQPIPPALSWSDQELPGDALADWTLQPRNPDWAAHWPDLWQPGAAGAHERLEAFIAAALPDYSDGRDRPATAATSRLSPHLQFGELSPRSVWHAARSAQQEPGLETQGDKFLAELGWREFSHYLLYHWPDLPRESFKPAFEHFPWQESDSALHAWQRGRTGYPLVDAGMRELWATGYMHNRVRMITASFLTKHLRLHWRLGARWFWDTLVDASLANNSASWQWVAGCGADAAPYFRIFNPFTQGEKFDRAGGYTRRWVPELARLPDRYLHRPWEAPPALLEEAGVTLGVDYPLPLVDHQQAREAALAAYSSIRT